MEAFYKDQGIEDSKALIPNVSCEDKELVEVVPKVIEMINTKIKNHRFSEKRIIRKCQLVCGRQGNDVLNIPTDSVVKALKLLKEKKAIFDWELIYDHNQSGSFGVQA